MNAECGRRQKGLTIVELMVGLVLGLFLLAGVIQVFVSSKQAFRTNEGLSRVQESGRFAMEFLLRDIRQAGFKGSCTSEVNNLLNTASPSYSEALYSLDGGIFGWNDTAGTQSGTMVGYQNSTDVVLLKHAARASGATASGNTPANANTINLTSASSIPKDAIIVVADARGCDIFQNRSNDNANNLTRGNTGDPGNLNPGAFDFSHAYDSSMEILSFRSVLYYIGTGASGLPALRQIRFDLGNAPIEEELVEGILDMQVLYGVDTDNNRDANDYRTANLVTDWESVVSARVCVVAISNETNVATESVTLGCNGKNVAVPNNRLGQVFTTTVGLRNRLP